VFTPVRVLYLNRGLLTLAFARINRVQRGATGPICASSGLLTTSLPFFPRRL
jgi:hypothetical protein